GRLQALDRGGDLLLKLLAGLGEIQSPPGEIGLAPGHIHGGLRCVFVDCVLEFRLAVLPGFAVGWPEFHELFRGIGELRLDAGDGTRRGEEVSGPPGENRPGLLEQVIVGKLRDIGLPGLGGLRTVIPRGATLRCDGKQSQAAEETDRDVGATWAHRVSGSRTERADVVSGSFIVLPKWDLAYHPAL